MKTGRRPLHCAGLAMAILCLVFAGLAPAQQEFNGNAAGFEIDNCGALFSCDADTATPGCTGKDVIQCEPKPKGDDWAQGACFKGVLDNNGNAVSPFRAAHFTDPNWGSKSPNAPDPTQFAGTSNKNNDYIDLADHAWTWSGTGQGPAKDDITNCYITTRLANPADPASDRWLIVAAETRSTNGDTHIDFEFNIAGVEICDSNLPSPTCGSVGGAPPPGVTEGFIVGLGPDGGRTVNVDFIISTDFVVGGREPVPSVRVWQLSGGVFQYLPVMTDLGGKVFTSSNSCDITHSAAGPSWQHFLTSGESTDVLSQRQMVEAAVNLTALGINVDPCSANTTVMFKTRSSASFTAELKDFALLLFPLEPTPECEISGPSQVCPNTKDLKFCVTETTGVPGTPTFEWTISGCAKFCDGTTEATGNCVCVNVDNLCNCQFTLVVKVTLGDCSSTCFLVVPVDDEVPPVITCPGPVTVQCPADIPPPKPASVPATDNCGPLEVTFVGDVTVGTCPTVITRTYRATDECGNMAECTQTIVVNDTTPPVITCPPDIQVVCPENVPPPATVIAMDNCDGPITATMSQTVEDTNEPAGDCRIIQRITRKYCAADACGNIVCCTQLITVVICNLTITCPPDITIECDQPIPQPDHDVCCIAISQCQGVTVSVTWEGDVSDGKKCPETITRTYCATDQFGLTACCTQKIVIVDDVPPVITCPSSSTVACNTPTNVTVTATDNCDPSPEIILVFNPASPSFATIQVTGNGMFTITFTGNGTVTVTATAKDDCGNVSAPCSFSLSANCVFESCSPGFWKQPQHFPSWCLAGYNPTANFCFPGPATLFKDAFAITNFSAAPPSFNQNITLLQAVSLTGGTFNQALFQGSAALLSSKTVNFPASPAQVQKVMQDAFAGVITFKQAQDTFSGWNSVEKEGGCPLD